MRMQELCISSFFLFSSPLASSYTIRTVSSHQPATKRLLPTNSFIFLRWHERGRWWIRSFRWIAPTAWRDQTDRTDWNNGMNKPTITENCTLLEISFKQSTEKIKYLQHFNQKPRAGPSKIPHLKKFVHRTWIFFTQISIETQRNTRVQLLPRPNQLIIFRVQFMNVLKYTTTMQRLAILLRLFLTKKKRNYHFPNPAHSPRVYIYTT